MKILTLLLLLVLVPTLDARQATPQSIVEDLLAADRAFSVASSTSDVVSGLSAMFADAVVLPYPEGIAYGKQKAIEALRANPINATGRLAWTPLRASVSGDGRHGFTAGFVSLRQAEGTVVPLKYLAYWEKQPAGWRVLAYKRVRAKVIPALTPMGNVLPRQLVEPATDATVVERYRESLAEAERSFSRDAQTMGIGPAFKEYGSREAINLGGVDTPGFLVGNEQIAAAVGDGASQAGSPLSWGPDRTIVAASGDFGVTIGFLRANLPGADGKPQPDRPFFTIWRRDSVKDPWRYIAE